MERGAREGDTRTSLDKLDEINRLCEELGVDTAPACVENVWLVPISSWYHASFDRYTSLSFVHSLSLSHLADAALSLLLLTGNRSGRALFRSPR